MDSVPKLPHIVHKTSSTQSVLYLRGFFAAFPAVTGCTTQLMRTHYQAESLRLQCPNMLVVGFSGNQLN